MRDKQEKKKKKKNNNNNNNGIFGFKNFQSSAKISTYHFCH